MDIEFSQQLVLIKYLFIHANSFMFHVYVAGFHLIKTCSYTLLLGRIGRRYGLIVSRGEQGDNEALHDKILTWLYLKSILLIEINILCVAQAYCYPRLMVVAIRSIVCLSRSSGRRMWSTIKGNATLPTRGSDHIEELNLEIDMTPWPMDISKNLTSPQCEELLDLVKHYMDVAHDHMNKIEPQFY